MDKEKQIEEMARDLENHTCMSHFQAEIASKMLYAKGYRKASEVAEEIFAEIEDVLNNIGYFDELDFNALKKKYTEGEG